MEDKIGTLTSQGGVDPPSKWGYTCLGLWFLNPSACQVHLHCIFYIVISCACFAYLLWNHFVYPYIVSLVVLRNFCRYFIEMTDKAHLFCLGICKHLSLRSGLPLTLHAWIDCIFFSFYACCCCCIFLVFQLSHGSLSAISVICALIEYAHILLRF
jgi:hypothetical protein